VAILVSNKKDQAPVDLAVIIEQLNVSLYDLMTASVSREIKKLPSLANA
jgi:hypothetical protein